MESTKQPNAARLKHVRTALVLAPGGMAKSWPP